MHKRVVDQGGIAERKKNIRNFTEID